MGSGPSKFTSTPHHLLISDSEWNNNNQGKFSYGDGSSNFRIPDFRGKFIRSLDSGAGIDGGRILGSYQMDAMQQITGTFVTPNSNINNSNGYTGTFYISGSISSSMASPDGNGDLICSFDSSRVTRTAQETRPRNISLRLIIKVKNTKSST